MECCLDRLSDRTMVVPQFTPCYVFMYYLTDYVLREEISVRGSILQESRSAKLVQFLQYLTYVPFAGKCNDLRRKLLAKDRSDLQKCLCFRIEHFDLPLYSFFNRGGNRDRTAFR